MSERSVSTGKARPFGPPAMAPSHHMPSGKSIQTLGNLLVYPKRLLGGGVLYDAPDQNLLLAAQPPSMRQRRLAYGAMACLLAVFCLALPYAHVQLQYFAAFLPIYATAIVIINMTTAAFLFAQFWVARWRWLLVIASSFLFTAMIYIPFIVTYPGIFAPSGLGGPQTGRWLGVVSNLVSPLFLIIAMLLRSPPETAGICRPTPGRAIVLSIALVTAIVCGLTWAFVANAAILPRVYVNGIDLPFNNIPIVMALDVAAFLLLWRRGRSVLELWLMAMCLTWLFQISLGGIFAGANYSFAWYTARIFTLISSLTVLLFFLSENTALYSNMAMAAIQRRGARQARQVAMDAMAASIAHEIKQPLTALIVNGGAGILLTKAQPDQKEVHAIILDMVAEGHRIAKIIGSVRTMFRESTHDRRLLDPNTVVRDVLSTVELELRLQRVIVKMDLDDGLPSILADDGQLHQVFLNLLTNAVEAMADVTSRPRVLTVSSRIVAGSSDIAITVEDTGVGITGEDTDRVFEPFFSTKAAGTGVGLTICRVIAEGHGGRLEVRTNQPFGTIFRVVLPVAEEE
jgi:signal transduction histidine kinase